MDIKIQTDLEDIAWDELAEVYERAPLGAREPEQLKRAFQKSYATCIVKDGDKLVAAGRAISDGEYYVGIFDIVVLPEYQGNGIGKVIMQNIIEKCDKYFMLLTTTIGKEPFYQKLGFRKHKTAMAAYPEHKKDSAEKYLE